MADTFLTGPLPPGCWEGVRRPSGDIVRLNQATREFGVITANRVIKTYLKRSALCTLAENRAYFEKNLVDPT